VNAPRLQGSNGPVQLGQQLGRGGEGAVFEVVGNADRVAKIYLKEVSPERSAKLLAMQTLRTPALDSLTAWPIDVLKLPNGKVGGFVMANMRNSKDIHALYSPKSRLTEFPNADWRMLVRAALNTAKAFAVLHEAGCLVGDVNHGGVRVAQDATVKLIDCDSFQITQGTRTFVCEVGVDNFTPAELQGKSFKDVVRTKNHDNFGLAVLVFQMLMMGRHPFAGRYRGPEDMPIDKAIGQFRYAYSKDTSTTGMQVPPNTAPVESASADVVQLWERAFGRGGTSPSGRPTAQEWMRALAKVETSFVRCTRNPAHYYHGPFGKCPWCPIEQIGVVLFPIPTGFAIPSAGGTFVLDVVWAQIKSVAPPPQVPAVLPSPSVGPSPEALKAKSERTRWKMSGYVVAAMTAVFGLVLNANWWLPWLVAAFFSGRWTNGLSSAADLKPFQDRYFSAHRNHEMLAKKWLVEGPSNAFNDKLMQYQKLRDELLGLPLVRKERYARLVAHRREDALRRFLDTFKIYNAKIPGIGRTKIDALESWNIETAADITQQAVMEVPGFGPALTSRLIQWRAQMERKFTFDPASSVDPRQVADLDRSIAVRRSELENELRRAPGTLTQIRATILARRQAIHEPLTGALRELAQANVDLNHVR
jgi:DNA-binding helix-hairpin-helix protein with protein kinase domain